MGKYVEINAFTDRVLQTMKYKHDKQLLINHCASYPRADVVEVVRCKDCKFNENVDGTTGCSFHNFWSVSNDGFCNYGERRKDND